MLLKLPVFSYHGPASCNLASNLSNAPASSLAFLEEDRAESVIELPLHTIFRSRTQVGDQLMIERYEAEKIEGQHGLGQREQFAATKSEIFQLRFLSRRR